MSHSFNKIWVHAIWTTKNREPFIDSELEPTLFAFIRDQFQEMGCYVIIINGMPDHIHCLFGLCRNKSIAEVIKQIKGSSSHFINQYQLVPEPFTWQNGYATFSVSPWSVNRVRRYIENQKSHHLKKSAEREWVEIIEQASIIIP